MPRTLYSPRLSDDVVRSLYREGQRRKMPMTTLADELLRRSLAETQAVPSGLRVMECSPALPSPALPRPAA